MPDSDNKSIDVLGIKPIGDSVLKVTEGSVEGASAFLSRICLPAAEEFGLLLRDKVSMWRAKNAVEITTKAQQLLEKQVGEIVLHAHPRIVYSAIAHGSWADSDYMQNLWAGLLASSCSTDGKDESNLILINILSQLTSSQGALIGHICKSVEVFKSSGGWIQSYPFHMDAKAIVGVMGFADLHQVDRELDHLKSLSLIGGGFHPMTTIADLTPTALCLQLYVRCQGYIGSPIDYFDAKPQ
jgi:hypothetical protein